MQVHGEFSVGSASNRRAVPARTESGWASFYATDGFVTRWSRMVYRGFSGSPGVPA